MPLSITIRSRWLPALLLALLLAFQAAMPAPAKAAVESACKYGIGGVPGLLFLVPLAAGDQLNISVFKVFGSPTTASLSVNGSSAASTSVPGALSYTVPSDGIYLLVLKPNKGLVGGLWYCTPASPPEPPDEPVTDSSTSKRRAGPPAMNLFDGRINNHQGRDVAAPLAIYTNPLKVYGIDPESGDGWLVIDISDEAIEAAGIPADEPLLLAQGRNHYTGIEVFLYRLPTGELQINTHYHDGKPYIFAWDADGGKWHFAW